MRILILSTSRPGHLALKEMGCTLVGFIRSQDAIPDDLKTGYENLFYLGEHATEHEYVSLAKVLHETSPFDAVCSFNDNSQHLCIEINSALGLEYKLTKSVLNQVYDKNLMRRTLQASGLDQTPQSLVGNTSQIIKFIEEHGFPTILKPLDATGSKGVSKIENYSQVDEAFAKIQDETSCQQAIIEAFIEGKELSVESISENGKHQVIAVTEKHKDPNTFIEIGHVVPAPLEPETKKSVIQFVEQVLESLGIIDGPTHTEIILSNNGPVIIETHTRPGGDRIDQLVKLAYGVDIFKLTARQIMGHEILQDAKPPEEHKYAAIWFAAPEMSSPHRLLSIKKSTDSASSEGVKEVKLLQKPGALIGLLKDSFSRTAFVMAEGDSYEEALSRAKDALGKLEIVISTK